MLLNTSISKPNSTPVISSAARPRSYALSAACHITGIAPFGGTRVLTMNGGNPRPWSPPGGPPG